jgi:hypothetical protein
MAVDPRPDTSLGEAEGPGDGATITAPVAAPVAPVVGRGRDQGEAPAPPPPAPPRAEADGREGRVRYEARQVQRLVTRVDPWSVLKVSIFLALSVFLAQILAEESFIIDGGQILRGSLIAGLVLVITGVVFAVVFSVLFNLISGLTGGVRLTVIELETARRRPAGRRTD